MKIDSKYFIKELGIVDNKIEFMMDMDIFLSILSVDKSNKKYIQLLKEKIDDYMGIWNVDLNKNFDLINDYIVSNKLAYKIIKDDDNLKSERILKNVLTEVYIINLIIENDISQKEILKNFVNEEFKRNNLNIYKIENIYKNFDYIFKNKKLLFIYKNKIKSYKNEFREILNKVVSIYEKKTNIKLDLNTKQYIKNVEIEEYKKLIKKLEEEIKLLKEENLKSTEQEQKEKVIIDLLKDINNSSNGNILDRLYIYLKYKKDENIDFILVNLFNVLRQLGIFPRETSKVGDEVVIGEYSFYDYRFDNDISDIKQTKAEVIYPSWFYKEKQVLKPYVKLKGD